jgi:DNA invertase Pin-like site-specific DNA recombinase
MSTGSNRRTRSQLIKARCRCAIYTRKSTEEGLEQDFNSLDAQREACESYIQSQKHEGWVNLPEHYDDGGFSGGNMERPAFKRLIEGIEASAVDTVVVYKVDRLTRSLSDFARIVDVFDRNNVSFVSVTQQFNTTTSMGRLTLNMLLSFAQFEREVTSERIRDKIAASKRKGLWMGGVPPVGYDVTDKKLIVNTEEAEVVRDIYLRYLKLDSVQALKASLDQDGFLSKVRINKYGKKTGGKPFSRGALYNLLQNRTYRGETVHKGDSYPGQHDAIVAAELWEQVQQKLNDSRVERRNGVNRSDPSLLVGLVHDDTGERMTPTHANKKGTRYRYYVSQPLTTKRRTDAPRGCRVPARDLEQLVVHRLKRFLTDRGDLYDALEPYCHDSGDRVRLTNSAKTAAANWDSLRPSEHRERLLSLVHRIDLTRESLNISIDLRRLPTWLDWAESTITASLFQSSEPTPASACEPESILTLTAAVKLKRVGIETRLLIEGNDPDSRSTPDHSLHRLLAKAAQYQDRFLKNRNKGMADLAKEAGVCSSYFTRVLRLSFLAPDIVQAILQNRHPVELNAERLCKRMDVPYDWEAQRLRLGID